MRRVAVLDPRKVNAKVTVFVSITTSQHNEEWLKRFAEVIRDVPEVVEFYRMSGGSITSCASSCPISRPMTPSTSG